MANDTRKKFPLLVSLPWVLVVVGLVFIWQSRPQAGEEIVPTMAPQGTVLAGSPSQQETADVTTRREAFRPQYRAGRQFASSRAVTPRSALTREEKTNIDLFRQYAPSVVFIRTAGTAINPFTLNTSRVRKGSGSGFIWDRSGHIVTNFHVVLSSRGSRPRIADQLQVFLSDQSSWPAKVVGVAPDRDLAVLKIEAPSDSLLPLPVGTSYDVQVGQKVLAIGSPFGLDQTLTTGIVSGLHREIQSVTNRTIDGVIQTDAAINPGNSGGPLLDSSGRLIGMNTAIFSPSGAYAGIGFAIPVDTVSRYVPELIENGRVIRPWLGVSLAPAELTKQHGIDGVLVIRVAPGGTAARSGIEATRYEDDKIVLGDIIVAMDDTNITNSEDLLDFLDGHEIGDPVTITVLRDVVTGNPRRVKLPAILQAQSEN